jgi:hypothetical protein
MFLKTGSFRACLSAVRVRIASIFKGWIKRANLKWPVLSWILDKNGFQRQWIKTGFQGY